MVPTFTLTTTPANPALQVNNPSVLMYIHAPPIGCLCYETTGCVGTSSIAGAYSLQSCFKNDEVLKNEEPLEEISIVVTASFGGIALLWVAIVLRFDELLYITIFC